MEIIVRVGEMGVGSLGFDGDRNLGRNTEELSVRLWCGVVGGGMWLGGE